MALDALPSLEEIRLPQPRGVLSVAGLKLNSLATSADVIKLQDEANTRAETAFKGASWKTLTIRTALQDAKTALFGIVSDLHGNTKAVSLRDMVTRDNRMRGIGVILVVVSFVWLLIDSMM